MKYLLFLLLAFSLMSCAGTPRGDTEFESPVFHAGETDIREQINGLLEEKRHGDALQLINYYKENHQDLDLGAIRTRALDGMNQLLHEALEKRQFGTALSFLESLEIMGYKPETHALDIKTAYIDNLLEYKKTGAAAALISLEYLDLAEVEADWLRFLADRFMKSRNRKALVLINEELKLRGMALPSDGIDFLNKPVRMEDLLEGTVTVWVDKGLKIEKGVGILDRNIGSGFFIDREGYILTNYHVIESEVDPQYKGYSRLFIKLSDDRGEKIPARVIGWDRHFDLALLKTEIEAPYVFSFASKDPFELGEKIFAIGSPGGLNNSITSGTVSALRRPFQTMGETIQIDVPINPGNSGGPLLNQDSEVNGMVFAGISQFEGVNFAIDGEYVKQLLPALHEGGALRHSWLGIGGFQDFGKVECLYVMPDSPAKKAGLSRGDTLVSINGKPLKRIQDARDALLTKTPGSIVLLEWSRNGESRISRICLQERPDIPLEEAIKMDSRENLIPPFFGMVISRVSRNRYTVDRVYTGSSADEASISSNDVIHLRKWQVNEDDKYLLMQFWFKGVKAGYLESIVQLAAGLESSIFF